MTNKISPTYPELDLQQFEEHFSADLLKDNPRFSYWEIEMMDFVLRQIDQYEKWIVKLENQDDKEFVLSGGYPFKFVLFFVSGWFLLHQVYPMHWFVGVSISLFFSILSLWFTIAADRTGFQKMKESNQNQIDDYTDMLQIYLGKKSEVERLTGEPLTHDFVIQQLEELQLWEKHGNERKIYKTLQSHISNK